MSGGRVARDAGGGKGVYGAEREEGAPGTQRRGGAAGEGGKEAEGGTGPGPEADRPRRLRRGGVAAGRMRPDIGGMRLRLSLSPLLAAGLVLSAAPPVAADWRAARWGMDAAAAQAAATAPARLIALGYGAGLAARLQSEERVGGQPFLARWQFDGAGGLRQVLLERRGAEAMQAAAEAVLAALTRAHGPPVEACATPARDGWQARWDVAAEEEGAGILHLSLFLGGGALRGFNRTIADLLAPGLRPPAPGAARPVPNHLRGTTLDRGAQDAAGAEARRRAIRGESPALAQGGVHRRSVAARLTLRLHDPAAAHLAGPRCPAKD